MKYRLCLVISGLLLAIAAHAGAEPNRSDAVRFVRDEGVLFLHGADLAAALDFDFKIVQPGRLLTFCRSGDEGFCIPLQFAEDTHHGKGQDLMLSADVLRAALRFRVIEADNKITVEPSVGAAGDEIKSAPPGYNVEWGPGRGFRQGETLPDIPLVDLAGTEVRFSQFLGKRYILYCWASW